MELNKYIFPLRKWWRLVVASTLIATIFSSLSVLRQPAIYQARTTLMIGTTINDPNPSSNELLLGQQLAAAYADLANREIIRSATQNALGLNRVPEYFARALPNTQLIEISVNDTDPQRAQLVANELASQLILLGPVSAQSEEGERQEFIRQRLDNLEAQIKETEAEIDDLQVELASAFSAQQINDIQDQIFSLQTKLNVIENNYGLLLSNTQQGAVNTLTVIDFADPPLNPVSTNKGLTILLAAATGFILAAFVAYLLEYLDDTLKTADEVERMFSNRIIGHVYEQTSNRAGDNLPDQANASPRHSLDEAFRALRTNIEITQALRPLKTILVTSADIGDGKTSVAANLALSIAQRDKDVVLLDFDLRRPSVHEFFGFSNDIGLLDLISDRSTINDVLRFKSDSKVAVLTTGGKPPNPAELLSSTKLDQVLAKLQEVADVVIIDGPPFFVTDATILASKVDGILVVVRPGHTHRSLAKTSTEYIKLVGAKVIGLVLNRIPLRGADYYAGRHHLYSYYGGNYGELRDGDENKTDLEKLGEFLLPYANKVDGFITHPFGKNISPYTAKFSELFMRLFKTVFKLSP